MRLHSPIASRNGSIIEGRPMFNSFDQGVNQEAAGFEVGTLTKVIVTTHELAADDSPEARNSTGSLSEEILAVVESEAP